MKRLERDHVGETMKALVVEGIKQFTYKDVPVPVLKDDEAVVRTFHVCSQMERTVIRSLWGTSSRGKSLQWAKLSGMSPSVHGQP